MEADEKYQELIRDIKNYLDITWEDTQGDKKIEGMVRRGMAALSGRIGECNFYEETQERALLFDYVMYCRAGEMSAFWANYQPEIISLQISRKVDGYAENEESI